jgi:glycolate oxidase FAD binding subunit
MSQQPETIEEMQELVRTTARLHPRGGGSKPALSTPAEGALTLNLSKIRGITAYEPAEFTITALAGTSVAEVKSLLAGHGQMLPFDPPLVERGATLGGIVAAGVSGPGRYQHGGVRDFLLGASFIDGHGKLVRGGARVVKNTAGFDLPKLMVGSLGMFGVLVELTFKIFPLPETTNTLQQDYDDLDEAVQTLSRLTAIPLEINAIDLTFSQSGVSLLVRLAGPANAMPARMQRLREFLGKGMPLEGDDEEKHWQNLREMSWVPEGWSLVRIPVTPGRIAILEEMLRERQVLRHYSGGGNLLWVAS